MSIAHSTSILSFYCFTRLCLSMLSMTEPFLPCAAMLSPHAIISTHAMCNLLSTGALGVKLSPVGEIAALTVLSAVAVHVPVQCSW